MTEDIIEHTLMQDVILFISEWVAGYLEQMKPTFRPTLSFSLLVVAGGGRNRE